MRRPILAGLTVAALGLGVPFFAHQASGHEHGHQHGHQHGHEDGHGHGQAEAEVEMTESTRAFMDINARMHETMDIAFTGDADVDFMRGMIPHHVAAVEMAEVVLEHGTDPQVRALAEAIIAAQREEIDFMEAWLEAR